MSITKTRTPKRAPSSKTTRSPRMGKSKTGVSPEQNRHEKAKKKQSPEKKSELGNPSR